MNCQNQIYPLKIGYNTGHKNLMILALNYAGLQKEEYLNNGNTDLYEKRFIL